MRHPAVEADELIRQFSVSELDNARIALWLDQSRWPGFRAALVKLAAFHLIDWQGNPDPALLKAAQRCLGAAQGHAYPNRHAEPPRPTTPDETFEECPY